MRIILVPLTLVLLQASAFAQNQPAITPSTSDSVPQGFGLGLAASGQNGVAGF